MHTRIKHDLKEARPDAKTKLPDVSTPGNVPYLRACVKEALQMTHPLIHHNEQISSDPLKFDPERWLQGEKSRQLEKYLVTFPKAPSNVLPFCKSLISSSFTAPADLRLRSLAYPEL